MKTFLKPLYLRIYPNVTQATKINSDIGFCRFLWNKMLDERIKVYEEFKDDKDTLKEHKHKTEKEWKREFEWLKDADSQALQQTRIDLETAFNNFFKSEKGEREGEKVGYPKFKSKKGLKQSFRTCNTNNNIKIDFEKQTIQTPKKGKIKFRHGDVSECFKDALNIKNITITRKPSGKYFASILFEMQKEFTENSNSGLKTKGLDMHLNKFYVDDEGVSPEYPKPFRKLQRKLKQLQRKHSRKRKGSQNRNKARLRVARCHEKIANVREDFLHKMSCKLIKENEQIVVENLAIKNMMKNPKWAKSVADLGWNSFIQMLIYKALWNGKRVLMADRWFASSKLCSVCGWKNNELLLSNRTWLCLGCGTLHNRDVNAAKNLKKIGQEVSELTPVEMRVALSLKQEAPHL